ANVPNQISCFWDDDGSNHVSSTCEDCDADVGGSVGEVNQDDLMVILSLWGQQTDVINLDGDGIVGLADLLIVLETWGPCPG
ncbi:MAG: hypothetical protein MK077_08860, partial [Phycisphaerales bacterium]|nr:hypothetical protein [Phycisphaerales bacterium]